MLSDENSKNESKIITNQKEKGEDAQTSLPQKNKSSSQHREPQKNIDVHMKGEEEMKYEHSKKSKFFQGPRY